MGFPVLNTIWPVYNGGIYRIYRRYIPKYRGIYRNTGGILKYRYFAGIYRYLNTGKKSVFRYIPAKYRYFGIYRSIYRNTGAGISVYTETVNIPAVYTENTGK